jgi:hypothetical protein
MTRKLCERVSRSPRWAGLAAVVLCGVVSLPAAAQPADQRPEDVATARALAVKGIELADAGDCTHAIPALERAEALRHAPTIQERLGECQIATGLLVLGTETLMRVIRETLPANAPASFRDAQARAQKALAAAQPRIAKLKIVLEPPVDGASVAVDGAPVPPAMYGIERATDPGTHDITAQAPGFRAVTSSVTLSDGGAETVTIKLEPLPGGAPVMPPGTEPPPSQSGPLGPTPPAPANEAPASKGGSRVPAYIAFGVGGAGLIAGAITGLSADKHCPPSAYDTLDSAKSMATISTIAFGVGIAGIAAGTVLLFTTDRETAAATRMPRAPRPRATRAYLGLGSLHLTTEF